MTLTLPSPLLAGHHPAGSGWQARLAGCLLACLYAAALLGAPSSTLVPKLYLGTCVPS